MYIINTIAHGKCFVRYLRTRCFCIRHLTRSLRSLVRFLIRQPLVRKYRTPPALSMKYSLYYTVIIDKFHTWLMGRQGNKTKEMYYSLTNLRINYFVLFHSLMYNCADRENPECMRTWAWTKSSILFSVSSNSC